MRKYIVPALVALTVALPGAAFAASTTATPAPAAATTSADQMISGTVKSFDLKARTLVLADGKSYELPVNFKDPGLKIGEKVTVHWKQSGTMNEVTSLTIS
ncbi:MAG: hypothetical protein ABS76_02825 [Pelagibacterium sp. SCN 64-44]|nr:MAG: hypothetical protein ABS76_02825 [Pelagibacterium sp. SCN 64-44]